MLLKTPYTNIHMNPLKALKNNQKNIQKTFKTLDQKERAKVSYSAREFACGFSAEVENCSHSSHQLLVLTVPPWDLQQKEPNDLHCHRKFFATRHSEKIKVDTSKQTHQDHDWENSKSNWLKSGEQMSWKKASRNDFILNWIYLDGLNMSPE